MPQTASMTDKQTVAVGVTILDQDGEAYDNLADLQALVPGATVDFVSSDESIAAVTVRPDGLNADIASVKKGTAVITVSVSGVTPALPSDTLTLNITNSSPASLNLTVGVPTDEV